MALRAAGEVPTGRRATTGEGQGPPSRVPEEGIESATSVVSTRTHVEPASTESTRIDASARSMVEFGQVKPARFRATTR